VHLNNNWYRNEVTGKWTPGVDNRNKADFDAYKEDFEKVRFYQKCLSGSTYVGVQSEVYGSNNNASISNVYDIIGYHVPSSYYYDTIPYLGTSSTPDDAELISTTASLSTFLEAILPEYNFTLKNLFTPERLINDQKQNLFYVDVISDGRIDDIYIKFEDLIIDGIRVKGGHRVLIKDQYTVVTIPTATDPDTYFYGDYEVVTTVGTNTKYNILNSQNGIYKYTKNKLVRTDDLDDYQSVSKYSICSKLGTVNREKQFKLKRLKTSLFPLYNAGATWPSGDPGEPMQFIPTSNFVIRNRVDYNNLYELVLNDTIKHATQSFLVTVKSGTSSNFVTYSIPERTITVGEFGSIIVDQEGVSNFINSKYKVTYRSIDETTRYYWICGDEGTILKVSKSDFSIERIQLKFMSYDPKRSSSEMVITKLNSITFFNNLRGAVVGDFNQIWVTSDGGKVWEQIYLTDFDGYNFNTAVFASISKFYVGGDNGVFVEFEYDLGDWYAHKRRISRYDDGLDDEYLLVDDINDINYITTGGNSYVLIGSLNSFYVYDVDGAISLSVTQNHDFWYIDNTTTVDNEFGDISSIIYGTGSSAIFSTFDAVYNVEDIFSGILSSTSSNIMSTTMSIVSTQSGINSLYRYNAEYISTGNFSLWQRTNIGATSSVNVYGDLFDRLKPRMLFMDYDIGAKLYWFDDFGQYRLPDRVQLPVSYLLGSGGNPSSISFNRPIRNIGLTHSETNWITYFKDRQKTFEYYSNLEEPNVVKPSFTFSSSVVDGKTFSYTASSITTDFADIVELMPNAVPPMAEASLTQSSRFRGYGNLVSAPTLVSAYGLYFYDYLGIWYIQNNNISNGVVTVGDVINISSDVFEGNFVVNKVFTSGMTGIGHSANHYFAYFYTDFNESILNNIKNSTSTFTIRNLNKYPVGLSNTQYFIDNFNKHYISKSYDIEELVDTYDYGTFSGSSPTQSFQITGKYSQWSSYYNLQSKVDVETTTTALHTTQMDYRDSFLNFGYSPNYNLLGYLNYLDPVEYTPNKEFLSMPNYLDVPGPDSVQPLADQVYIDTAVDSNKAYFGSNLKYIWEHLFIWTFVDVVMDAVTTERLLIIGKEYDSSTDQYYIEFHDKLNTPATISLVSILGRRTLQQISEDLQYANGIHRPEWHISESHQNTPTITGTWSNFETELKFKVPSDSYTKILLTDSHAVRDITSIIYTDDDYELSAQVTKLNREYEFNVDSISNNGGVFQFTFVEKHNLYNEDSIVVSLIGSQSDYPETLLGYHNIGYVNDYSITLPITYTGPFAIINLSVSHVKRDPFFNFQPIDLFDMGIGDKKVKQSIEVPIENYEVNGYQYDIFNIDMNKYRFRLIDGLDLVTLNSQFQWILEAEISNAVIGLASDGKLNWYRGVWHCGRWFGGNWISGDWLYGDWYDGKWSSKFINDKKLSVEVDDKRTDYYNSNWYGGRWFGGSWENGTWNAGRWYGGTWENGRWFDGTWNNGVWNNGIFKSGIWALGQWNNGIFNTDNGLSHWIDGKFYGGDFENGTWYNGIFDEKNGKESRFGTKSSNSRNSVWRSGKFLNGEFHSYLNKDDEGNTDVSESHKYSKWMTGLFAAGDWYGGLSYNINFKNAVWHGGISEEIDILSGSGESIILDGDFEFNTGDEFYVVDNINGYNQTPDRYVVLSTLYNPTASTTDVTVTPDGFTYSVPVTNLKAVSSFISSTWNSGVWYNGVFKGGVFNGGIWYNGYFEGTWG